MGIDIISFLIPDSEVKPCITSISSLTWDNEQQHTEYSDEKYVRKSIFLTKLDGILNYLNYILKEPDKTIGFKNNK